MRATEAPINEQETVACGRATVSSLPERTGLFCLALHLKQGISTTASKALGYGIAALAARHRQHGLRHSGNESRVGVGSDQARCSEVLAVVDTDRAGHA